MSVKLTLEEAQSGVCSEWKTVISKNWPRGLFWRKKKSVEVYKLVEKAIKLDIPYDRIQFFIWVVDFSGWFDAGDKIPVMTRDEFRNQVRVEFYIKAQKKGDKNGTSYD